MISSFAQAPSRLEAEREPGSEQESRAVGRRIDTKLQCQGRMAERLLIEVVQGAEMQVAGVKTVVDLPRVSEQDASHADLEVRERPIEHFHGEEALVGTTPGEPKAAAGFDG